MAFSSLIGFTPSRFMKTMEFVNIELIQNVSKRLIELFCSPLASLTFCGLLFYVKHRTELEYILLLMMEETKGTEGRLSNEFPLIVSSSAESLPSHGENLGTNHHQGTADNGLQDSVVEEPDTPPEQIVSDVSLSQQDILDEIVDTSKRQEMNIKDSIEHVQEGYFIAISIPENNLANVQESLNNIMRFNCCSCRFVISRYDSSIASFI